MKKSLAVTFLLIGPLLPAASALDLTPHSITTSFSGFRVNRYFFEDEGKRMGFTIDNRMTVKGTSASAAFDFEDRKNSGMKILRSPKNPEAPFGEKELESYRANARALVPASATDVQLDQENPGAVAINGWTSYQFIFAYKLFGFPYRRSITFLNYNKTEQLIVDVSAPVPEFAPVYLRSYQVLNSMTELGSNNGSGPT